MLWTEITEAELSTLDAQVKALNAQPVTKAEQRIIDLIAEHPALVFWVGGSHHRPAPGCSSPDSTSISFWGHAGAGVEGRTTLGVLNRLARRGYLPLTKSVYLDGGSRIPYAKVDMGLANQQEVAPLANRAEGA